MNTCGRTWGPVLPGPLGGGVEHLSDYFYPKVEKATDFIYQAPFVAGLGLLPDGAPWVPRSAGLPCGLTMHSCEAGESLQVEARMRTGGDRGAASASGRTAGHCQHLLR